jgi:hypothetical protein
VRGPAGGQLLLDHSHDLSQLFLGVTSPAFGRVGPFGFRGDPGDWIFLDHFFDYAVILRGISGFIPQSGGSTCGSVTEKRRLETYRTVLVLDVSWIKDQPDEHFISSTSSLRTGSAENSETRLDSQAHSGQAALITAARLSFSGADRKIAAQSKQSIGRQRRTLIPSFAAISAGIDVPSKPAISSSHSKSPTSTFAAIVPSARNSSYRAGSALRYHQIPERMP